MEVDTALSSRFSKVIIDSKAVVKLGLTGTINSTTTVYRDSVSSDLHGEIRQSDTSTSQKRITNLVNKAQLLEILLPVVIFYPVWQAVEDGVLNNYQTYIVNHKLNNTDKYIKAFKKNTFLQTEMEAYTYLDKQRKSFHMPQYYRMMCVGKCRNILYELKSKVAIGKIMARSLPGKTIFFGIRKDLLRQITPNVLESSNFDDLINKFKTGEITNVASSQLISRGLTLHAENVVFFSYYTTSSWFLQSACRSLRKRADGKKVNMYIFRTDGTMEEKWFAKMTQVLDYKGELIHDFDLKVKKIITSEGIAIKHGQSN